MSDFTFIDRTTGTKLTYEVGLFHQNPHAPPLTREGLIKTEVGLFDLNSHSFQVGSPLSPMARLNEPVEGSAVYSTLPWAEERRIAFTISWENFKTGLGSLKNKGDYTGSLIPADYFLKSWHINAEMQYDQTPTQLGWSLSDVKIALVKDEAVTATPRASVATGNISQEIWMFAAPHRTSSGPGWEGVRNDAGDMWKPNAPWETVGRSVKAIQFAPTSVDRASAGDLKEAIEDIKRRNISLAVGDGLLIRSDRCRANTEAYVNQPAGGHVPTAAEQRRGREIRDYGRAFFLWPQGFKPHVLS